MTTSNALLGAGWAWPPRLDAQGCVATVTGAEVIERSIELILRTEPGERPMRPAFGCPLSDFVFAPVDRTTAGRLQHAVLRALEQWEPRIRVERVDVTSDSASACALHLTVTYVVRTTNDRRNLVFPFYVLPDEQA